MGYFCPKNTFLQLRHIQRIYLTLFSTTCAKIRQMTYAIFETSRKKIFLKKVIFHDTTPLYSFNSNITYFLQKQHIKVQIFRFSTACIINHQIPHVIFQTKDNFSSKFGSFFIVMKDNSSVLFQLKLYMLPLRKVALHQSANVDLPLFALKFTKFLSVLQPRASLSSNFASLFSAVTRNSSVLLHVNLYMLQTKETHQSANFHCSHEN